MLQILNPITTTLEVNKSKFICYLIPYHLFEIEMIKIKELHPKARHFVYAYRNINEFEQIVENQSDDGEPKGSSGPPTLSVLRGKELINTAAIIVRYFGGIKLGVGGLVRAYGKSVNLTIEEAELQGRIEIYVKRNLEKYEVLLKDLAIFEHFLKEFENITIEKDFHGLNCLLSILTTKENHITIKTYLRKRNFI